MEKSVTATPSVINLVYRGIEHFELMIKNRAPFSFARYGDGEWMSILGYSGRNCDGVQFNNELKLALTETLKYPQLNDNYYYGMLAIAFRYMRPYIEKFTYINNLDITWTEATFLVAANRQGQLSSFLRSLRKRSILYVGPAHLRAISDIIGLNIKHFIDVPNERAFEERERIKKEVLRFSGKADFVGFSAGPATKWLIWSLYPHLGQTHTLFDFGSIFDGYVGRPSRKYQRRKTWRELVRSNLQ